MNIVITGASGFIGRRLLRNLAKDGHSLHVLSRHAGTNLPGGVRLSVWDAMKGPPPADALRDAGATELCTVLSDIPMVTARDIDEVFAALKPGRGAVLVPSRDFTGTNIIARSPAGVIPTLFGRMSLVKHLDECRRANVPCEIIRQTGPALDLDLLADLIEFVRSAGPSNTLNQLARLGIASN